VFWGNPLIAPKCTQWRHVDHRVKPWFTFWSAFKNYPPCKFSPLKIPRPLICTACNLWLVGSHQLHTIARFILLPLDLALSSSFSLLHISLTPCQVLKTIFPIEIFMVITNYMSFVGYLILSLIFYLIQSIEHIPLVGHPVTDHSLMWV